MEELVVEEHQMLNLVLLKQLVEQALVIFLVRLNQVGLRLPRLPLETLDHQVILLYKLSITFKSKSNYFFYY